MRILLLGMVVALSVSAPIWATGSAEEPALPSGLGQQEPDEPGLPPGLGEQSDEVEDDAEDGDWTDRLPRGLRGFVEGRLGPRITGDPVQSEEFTLAEARLQIAYERAFRRFSFDAKGDLVLDAVLDEIDTDLRSLRMTFRPVDTLDFSIGRQVMTWGTGDLLFINDLFPKDWPSFFIGRDEEYLKAPSDALRIGWFPGKVSFDVVYTPRFDPDRFIRGERISFWDPLSSGFRGEMSPVQAIVPDDLFDDDEVAIRVYGNAGSYELSAYGYSGFWKSPGGIEPVSMRATFPALDVWGASVRGPVAGGIGNVEIGLLDSKDDPAGTDPFANNSETRLLVGYERELGQELTGGFQYYLERLSDYDAYLAALPGGNPRDEHRHVLTTRITKLLRNQTLIPSLFVYYSPSDADGYLRPKLIWKRSDRQIVEFGANLFFGRDDFTFFGQFTNNSNVYASIRFQP